MRKMSHVGTRGEARMVDVTAKEVTERVARAVGYIVMKEETLKAIRANTIDKGDVIAVARVAGVMAAKRTAELIPLCHPLPLTDIQVNVSVDESRLGLKVEATARTVGRTGVEMEAIMAVSVALITIYDMAKAIDRDMRITDVCLLEKKGGRSGSWQR